jgi:hypothetical protein
VASDVSFTNIISSRLFSAGKNFSPTFAVIKRLMTNKSFLKQPAQFISYLLHPLFMPFYLMVGLIYVTPSLFSGQTPVQNVQLLLSVLLNMVFFPAFTLFLMKQLKLVKSYYLENRKERIVPIFATTVFAFWVWAFVLWKNPAHYPWQAVRMGLGFFLGASFTLVCNSFYKISLHAIGVGMLCGLSLGLFLQHIPGFHWIFLLVAVVVAAIVILARRLVSNHTPFELYSGFMLGFIVQLLCQLL